jgi:hypothetical protein
VRPTPKTILAASVLWFGAVQGSTALLLAASEGEPASPRVSLMKAPEGGIQPQAVIDRTGTVHLVYFKGEPSGGDLFYTRLEPGKDAFAPPVRVNSQPGSAIAIGTIRGAHIALGRGGRIHVAWNGSGEATPKNSFGSAPMLYSRSDRSGVTFEPQRNLMRRTFPLDGGGTIAADDKGNVYVAWHGRSEDSEAGEAGRRMWVARSTNDGATFSAEEPAFEKETGACGCCGTRALADHRGRLYMLYRAATEGTGRDMYLLTSGDHGDHFEGRMIHPWKFDACPMSSASLSESGADVLAAWETKEEVYFTRIDSKSRELSTPVKPPGDGRRKHPAVAGNDRGETILVWAEGTGWQKGGALAWRVFDRVGRPTGRNGRVEEGIPVWGLATVVARPDGSFLIVH